jgi:hypothetical protein
MNDDLKIKESYADGASDNLQINADKMQIKCRYLIFYKLLEQIL